MLNSVIMMGRLTAEPELRRTQSDIPVTSFTIAVERSFAKQGAERQTDFFDVVAWNRQADFVCKYFHKGQLVAVQGRLETRSYEDKNGNRRKAYEIIADSLHFAEGKRDGYGAAPAPRYDQDSQVPPAFSNADSGDFEEITTMGDDLPF